MRLSYKETTQCAGDQGDDHRSHGLGKLTPAGMYWEWEGTLDIDLPGKTPGDGNAGLVMRCTRRHMLPVID